MRLMEVLRAACEHRPEELSGGAAKEAKQSSSQTRFRSRGKTYGLEVNDTFRKLQGPRVTTLGMFVETRNTEDMLHSVDLP